MAEKNTQVPIFDAEAGKIELVDKVIKSDKEWQEILAPEQYRIMRRKGTEPARLGFCEIPKEEGLYKCAGCGTDLFSVNTKFDSKTGWPSFWEPLCELNIRPQADNSSGMQRIEVLCARCDAHLGHVFDDGPPPTGKRYCINSAALKFKAAKPARVEKATFAAGCFWGVEEAFRTLPGVLFTRAGYTGGHTRNPTYEQVCSHKSGHAEAVEVFFDPEKISYKKLLDVFWSIHDPTQLNRQGPDVGAQYRSVIFYHNAEQEESAQSSKKNLEKAKRFKGAAMTEVTAAAEFYPAEDYHQQYYLKRGIKPACHIPGR